MTTLRTKSGITDAEWIRTTVDEARSDPVGMWRIVRAGREGFALVGGDHSKTSFTASLLK